MFDRKKLADDFSRSAPHYAQHADLQKRIGLALIDMATPFIADKLRLLDVGAGSGELTLLWPCAEKMALDMAPGMCAEAQKNGLDVTVGSAEDLPFSHASYQLVVSNVMLQWLDEPKDFFAEAHRVLESGGLLCCSNFMHGTLSQLDWAYKHVLGYSPVSPFMTHAQLLDFIASAGFELLVAEEECYTENYASLDDLFTFLRSIGASNKLRARGRGLLTPRKLQAVRAAYPAQANGISANWQVSRVIARKK